MSDTIGGSSDSHRSSIVITVEVSNQMIVFIMRAMAAPIRGEERNYHLACIPSRSSEEWDGGELAEEKSNSLDW